MRNFIFLTLLSVFLIAPSKFLFSLSTSSEITIAWGKTDSELGVFQEDDYRRGPLYFAVDENGFVYIADAYKARIAVFDAKGKFDRAIDLEDISPRITYFARHADGSFVLCNDQLVQRVTEKGVRKGSFSLGLTLPDRFWSTTSQTYILGKAENGTISLVFNADFTQESTLALQSSRGPVASVKDEKSRIWLPTWSDQAKTFHWTAEVAPNATLFAVDAEGQSVWSLNQDGSRQFWKLDLHGKLIESANLLAPALPVASVSYSADENLSIYQSHWDDKGFVLVKLLWSK